MGKSNSKEQVVIAQNANGDASATTTQYHNEKLAMIEILVAVCVVALILAIIYYMFKKCNKHFVRTIQRELNSNNIASISRSNLVTSTV